MNSNAKLTMLNKGGSKTEVDFLTTGGVLDFMIYYGNTAEDVIKLYHKTIGKPNLPPFWSLGYFQSSWAYDAQGTYEEVLSNYREGGYPLEGFFFDIEYMDEYKNFEVDKVRFPTMLKFVENLKNHNQRSVFILDAGIGVQDNHWYDDYKSQEIFIKSASNPTLYDGNLIGAVWPGRAAFPDFWCPDTQTFWD